MWLKKSSTPIHDPEEHISAIVMPHKGHTDDEVADFFADFRGGVTCLIDAQLVIIVL